MQIIACLKWVTRSPLTAATDLDERFAGMSPADEATLEWALRAGEAWGVPVTAITVGPEGADAVLRAALAAGCQSAIRIDSPTGQGSAAVAVAIADRVDRSGSLVCCGDYSLDRGTGSVPAFIAARTGGAQMLGLTGVEIDASADGVGRVRAERRLDGGRRERLLAKPGGVTVISVEGSAATLRRAGLSATMRAAKAPLTIVPGPADHSDGPAASTTPFRPRPRVLPPPSGSDSLDRIRALLDAGTTARRAGDPVVLEPAAAADRILDSLRDWGYLDET